MITKIEGLRNSYNSGIINISGDVVIYADDGITELHRAPISASCNVKNPDMKDVIVGSMTESAQSIKDTYVNVMAAVAAYYPDASTPSETLDLLAADIEGGIV